MEFTLKPQQILGNILHGVGKQREIEHGGMKMELIITIIAVVFSATGLYFLGKSGSKSE